MNAACQRLISPIPFGWLLGVQIALLAIYLSSTIVRTLFRGFTFTTFETGQCALAFLIGVGGGLRLSHGSVAIGIFALLCAGACYVVSFSRLDRAARLGRNFYTYSTFGILLVLAGSRMLLAGGTAPIVWSGLAVGCLWAGVALGRLTLQVHGGLYLLLALAGSGALAQSAALILGTMQWPFEGQWAQLAGTATAALCYLLAIRKARDDDGWNTRLFRLAVAATLVWLLAGVTAGALTAGYHFALGAAASHAYCAHAANRGFGGRRTAAGLGRCALE